MSTPAPPSDRSFGTLFTCVFALLGGYWWWRSNALFPWAFGASALMLVITLAAPGGSRPRIAPG